jgi:hypothetical protein
MKHVNLLEEEWEFLTDLLPQDWREQARTTGALRRARGVSSADCLLQLILMHTATGLSLRQTVVRARQQSIADISDVALLKRLRCQRSPGTGQPGSNQTGQCRGLNSALSFQETPVTLCYGASWKDNAH